MTTTLSRARPCFGTLVTVSVRGPQAARADHLRAIEAAFAACDAVQRALSAHDPDSDLGRIAHASDGAVLTVSPHTIAVLGLARQWRAASGGRFDPAVGRRLAADGLRPGLAAGADGSLADIESLASDRVRVRRAAALDFGGLAKGYGVDRAIEALQAAGVAAGLVNAGGDLRAFGRRQWPLALRETGSPTRLHRPSPTEAGPARAIRRLDAFALATSGTWLVEPGQRCGTLVDPPRGRRLPASEHGCTVLAPDAATADALTKLVLLSPALPTRVLAQARARAWLHRPT